MSIRAWQPLNVVNRDMYLYHYTSLEKAYSILYNNELWFSDLTNTNDIFEQKVKISFESLKTICSSQEDYEQLLEKVNKVREYMNNAKKRIKLLCFSQDTNLSAKKERDSFQKLMNSLSDYSMEVNVIGRGFSLPRMWAQYASNNRGLCFIFNKKKLLNKVKESNHVFIADKVEYHPLYNPYMMSVDEFKETLYLINTEYDDALKTMIKNKSAYLKYDLFSKLLDWSSENEFRIILTNNTGEGTVKLKNITDMIEGIVYGSETDSVNTEIIKFLGKDLDVRKIVYEDMITRIQSEK